jgi:type I restriction enzyme S subunit
MSEHNDDIPEGFQMTELGPLPKEWRVVRFDQAIARATRVPKVKQSDYQPIGLVPIIDQGQSFIAGYTDKVSPYKDNLPVIVFGDHTRVLKFVDFPFVAGADGTQVLIPDSTLFDPLFVYYALSTIEIPSRGYNRHFSLLRESSLPLPPLPEQRAIAHVLRTVQRAKEATEGVIAALRELKKSLMQHLFTCGPVPVTERERVALQESEIGPLPAHWRVVRLGEVAEFRRNKTIQQPKTSLTPFIPMSLLPEDTIYISQWEMRRDEEIRSGIAIQNGDFLLAKITPSFENGKQGIVKDIPGGWGYATTEVIPIRPYPELHTEYLAFYLKQPSIRQELAGKMEGSTGRQRLPKMAVQQLPIPLPPLDEQREIARILQAVDAKIAAEQARRTALEELFKSMLHLLMTGKVRVKEDLGSQNANS